VNTCQLLPLSEELFETQVRPKLQDQSVTLAEYLERHKHLSLTHALLINGRVVKLGSEQSCLDHACALPKVRTQPSNQ
jgi:hypothetical protein